MQYQSSIGSIDRGEGCSFHVKSLSEFVDILSMRCCILFLEFLNYHPVRGKTASANALEMTISSWVDPEYPLCRAFIGGQHGILGKVEAVVGTLLRM